MRQFLLCLITLSTTTLITTQNSDNPSGSTLQCGEGRQKGTHMCVPYYQCDATDLTILPDNPTNLSKCRTPPQPEHGRWMYSNKSLGQADSEVNKDIFIIFACDDGYKLSSTNEENHYTICLGNDVWSGKDMPTCLKLCTPFYDTDIITYTCRKDGYLIPCDKATDNTVRTIKCAAYYEPVLAQSRRSTCLDGRWSYNLECVLVCGESNIPASTLIVGGTEAKRGSYPWMATLYRYNKKLLGVASHFEFICGGSLISLDAVLTAAHCVTKKETGEILPLKDYRVGAGKLYNRFQDERDRDTAMYSEVEDIQTYKYYVGEVQNFRGDIALMKLKNKFTPSRSILPVCFIDPPKLKPNMSGVVVGWGFTTETGHTSDKLKEVQLPYKEHEDCFNSFGIDFARRYVIEDKICAGYNNQGTGICSGDSGGGLVFKNRLYYDRYFVYGIASLSETFVQNNEVHCNVQKAALFTEVDKYIEWIQLKLLRWNLKIDTGFDGEYACQQYLDVCCRKPSVMSVHVPIDV